MDWVSAVDLEGRTTWIVDAHGYGKRFIVRADEILTAFLELEAATTKPKFVVFNNTCAISSSISFLTSAAIWIHMPDAKNALKEAAESRA